MAKNTTITQAELLELLRYEPETGKLYWRERGIHWFENTKNPKNYFGTWNTRFSGKEITCVARNGYIVMPVLGMLLYAHRVVWMMSNGVWPDKIDHINGVRVDNRLTNLRDVSQSANMRNSALRVDNKSGHHGVVWNSRIKRWKASITKRPLGHFKTFEEALAARKAAEIEEGYHPNHGRNP